MLYHVQSHPPVNSEELQLFRTLLSIAGKLQTNILFGSPISHRHHCVSRCFEAVSVVGSDRPLHHRCSGKMSVW